jgi:predicted methyltransferase
MGKRRLVLLIAVFVASAALRSPADAVTADPPGLPDSRALTASADPPAQPAKAKPKGRLFAAQDLGLLEAPDRDQWQKPDQIMDALGIADGSVVADLGAAGGWFTLQLARRVGPNGLVYAEDIQPQMIEAISRRMQNENLLNVRPVLGTASDPRLPFGLDAAIISDAYREMDDPADHSLVVTLLTNVARSLKPQGRLGIVDYLPGGGGPGPAADLRVDPNVVIAAAHAAGLELVKREDFPPFVYLLSFGRSPSGRASP